MDLIWRYVARLVRGRKNIVVVQQHIHKIYKQFVPTRWRMVARWVWGMALVSGVLWWQAAASTPPLTVYFYDVGQGDAIHVRTSEGFDVLIDGGPTGRVVEKLGRTMPFWDDTIELMVLTHPHADHAVGQIEVLRRFNVEQVLATGVLHTTDEYIAWLEEIKKQKIPMDIVRAGMWVGLGGVRRGTASEHERSSSFFSLSSVPSRSRPRPAVTAKENEEPTGGAAGFLGNAPPPSASPEEIVLEILWPQESFEGKRVREGKIGEGGGLNDTSIVAKLTYGQTSFLFMGDATAKVEEKLLREYNANQRMQSESTNNANLHDSQIRMEIRRFALSSDVLKVGHHGSKYSTSRAFLKAVQPKYAVIQVGENRYGHPAFAALHRLEQARLNFAAQNLGGQAGVKVLRNDQDGDIACESDGNTLACKKQ